MPLPTNLVSTDGDCPLCGGPNGCDVAAGQDGGACWCLRASIPEAARARVPEHLRDRRCLCPTCAQTACAAQGSGCVASFS